MNKLLKKVILIAILFLLVPKNIFAYNKAVVDITTMDIYEIQDAIDKGYLTYELLAKLYLDRIEAYDSKFNTIISLNENIIEEAKKKDIEYQKNGRSSIVFGIPILVKDNIDVYGMPTTAGAKSLQDNYPKKDAKVIENLKKSGALIIGKTNMSEFAFYASSSISSYGTVKNAYDTYFTSYGSSGGTAVGVSLQFATLGIGTDTNASLRLPASANNVIGFRPTFDLINTSGVIGYDITRDTVGPITKNAKENAVMLAIMSGEDEDYYLKDIDDLDLEDVKIGVINDFLYGNDSGLEGTSNTYTEIENLMKNVLEKLKENGVEIVYIDNFYKKEYYDINNKTLGGWTFCHNFNNYIKNTTSKINSFYELVLSSGKMSNMYDYVLDCNRDINKIDDYYDVKKPYDSYVKNVFSSYGVDFLVYPISKNRVLRTTENTSNLSITSNLIAPVLGYPAVSVSLGSDVEGLYYGMEILGLKNEENKIYSFINKYEEINNTYKLSPLAKPLYEVPSYVEELKELYENNSLKRIIIKNNVSIYKKYKQKEEVVENILFNYNKLTEEEIESISKIKDEYKELTLELNKEINIGISIIIVLLIFVILFFIFKYKKLKKKQND